MNYLNNLEVNHLKYNPEVNFMRGLATMLETEKINCIFIPALILPTLLTLEHFQHWFEPELMVENVLAGEIGRIMGVPVVSDMFVSPEKAILEGRVRVYPADIPPITLDFG